ncbi:hypothetical protein Sm713_36200 [Streptomyces sp. TS71-3]|nr:hypothetical protein Sm713_36200 [Streptomyces sp. TS71-3]
MVVHPSGVDLSNSALRSLTQQLRRHRRDIGSRWRRLGTGRRTLLTLAHLRVGHTCAHLAAGFGIGTTTAYRYVTEAVEPLATLARSLADAVQTASMTDRPFYSGKQKKQRMNVQVIAVPFDRQLWASPALPGDARLGLGELNRRR